MTSRVVTLVSGGATATGTAFDWIPSGTGTGLVQAYLDADGGTATVILYGRLGTGAPWRLLATFELSGANDTGEWLIDNEPWAQLRADITAISGTGAMAACEVGY